MQKFSRSVLTALMLATWATAARAAGAEPPPALIPQPVKFERTAGSWTLSPQTHVNAAPGVEAEGRYLIELLAGPMGQKMTLDRGPVATGSIVLALDPQLSRLGSEGYTLNVGAQGVRINAATSAGVFNGVQTLRQLLPASIESSSKAANPAWTVNGCTIEDQPRYPWRGILLDTSRHFFPKSFILREIDLLALHKMNVFHWHLTDDQGWRIEIKKYPRLTEVGAWRKATATDTDWGAAAGAAPMIKDGQYGGFYTQDDIREVVKYAASRHVSIVPEIEMPGHSQAALAAYPNLSCTGGPFTVATNWGVHTDVYCAGKEQTFEFLQNVLDEVFDLFPGTIHIGGDECPKTRWLACPDCKKRMADNGLKDGQELQSYFIKRMGAYIASKNRKFIGWNEILQGGLAPGASVMSWQGMSGGRTAALQQHDVVMTPESNCYYDHLAEASNPRQAYASVPLSRAYAFVPTPPDLAADVAGHILGAQGNIWGERIATSERADYMTFPRASALAEALWTAGPQNYTEFAARLRGHLARLDVLGVKYQDDPLARAVEIGKWAPAQMSRTTNVELEWDLKPYLTAPGPYTVRFEFLDGRDLLRIHSVELQKDGQALVQDTHEAQAGGATRANTFQITLAELAVGAKYTLRASINSPSGTDSRGQVFLIKEDSTASGPATAR